MIAPTAPSDEQIGSKFAEMLPTLTHYLHRRLAGNASEAREEMVAEGVALAWQNYLSASRRGKEISAGNLAWFGAKNVLAGRCLAGACSMDALADGRRGPDIDSLAKTAPTGRGFYMVFGDRRWKWPVIDYVGPRMDWADFWRRLPSRDRRLLRMKADQMPQTQIAETLGITPARVCQLLSKLRRQWEQRGSA